MLNEISIRTKTRDELIGILAIILPYLPKIAARNIDADVQMALGQIGVGSVEELKGSIVEMVSRRREEVRGAYNAMVLPALREEDRNKVIAATTEEIAANDIFFVENIQKAEAQGIVPCFIYGSTYKTEKEARAFISACGYTGNLDNIIFANKNDHPSYDSLVRAIQEKARVAGKAVSLDKIGIRAADQEVYTEERDGKTAPIGKLLAVQPFELPNGEKMYVTINTYQMLLGIVEGMTLEALGIPGLAQDAKGIFRYLPRSAPIDYEKEIGTYKRAIEVVATAA
jgi:hypothetical protein